MNIYTVQTPKACPLIGIFCMNMQKIHKCNRLLGQQHLFSSSRNYQNLRILTTDLTENTDFLFELPAFVSEVCVASGYSSKFLLFLSYSRD
jgi:hypothetical protein